MAQPYRIVDFSWGMNTNESEYMIPLDSAVLLKNMTTEWNRVVTLPGFSVFRDWGGTGKVQWGQNDGSRQVWIHNNTVYYFDDETKQCAELPNAVGIWVNGTVSDNEDYNITIYKNYIIITNSLKTWCSTLECEWETPCVLEFQWDNICIEDCQWETKEELVKVETPCLWDNYTPTVSFVHNWILFFGWGPRWSTFENLVKWWGQEWDNLISTDYFLDFCTDVAANTVTGFQFIWSWEPITSFFSNGWDLHVWTTWWVHEVNISTSNSSTLPVNFLFNQITSTWIKNQETVVDVNNNTIYYDGTDLRILEYDLNSWRLNDLTLTDKIRPFMDCLAKNQKFATMAHTYPYVKLFLRTNDRLNGNDIAIVYNVETGALSIQCDILVSHAWSGYDDRSDSWKGFWGDDFSNTIYEDWVWYTWADEPRTFEYIGRMYNLWDCGMKKEFREANVCIKHGRDVDVTIQFDKLITKRNNVTKVNGKKTTISLWEFNNTSIPTSLGCAMPHETNCKDLKTIQKSIKRYQCGTWFQPHIIGTGTWYFEMEYLDLDIDVNFSNKYIA